MNSTISSMCSNDEGFDNNSNSLLMYSTSSRKSIDSDTSSIPSLLHSEYFDEEGPKKKINMNITEDCILSSSSYHPLLKNNQEL